MAGAEYPVPIAACQTTGGPAAGQFIRQTALGRLAVAIGPEETGPIVHCGLIGIVWHALRPSRRAW